MKTFKKLWLMPLILVSFLFTSCDEDDTVDPTILDAETTGIFLEQDLHLRYLGQQYDMFTDEIAAVESALKDDPDNQDLQGLLEELKENQQKNQNQQELLVEEIAGFLGQNEVLIGVIPRIGPFPPPPNPCNCFGRLDYSSLKQLLLIGNTEGFSAVVRTENQEEVANFGELSSFEDSLLNQTSLLNAIDAKGNVFIEITKIFDGDLISYTIAGVIN